MRPAVETTEKKICWCRETENKWRYRGKSSEYILQGDTIYMYIYVYIICIYIYILYFVYIYIYYFVYIYILYFVYIYNICLMVTVIYIHIYKLYKQQYDSGLMGFLYPFA